MQPKHREITVWRRERRKTRHLHLNPLYFNVYDDGDRVKATIWKVFNHNRNPRRTEIFKQERQAHLLSLFGNKEKNGLINLSIWTFYLIHSFSFIYHIIWNEICPYDFFGHPVLSLYLCIKESITKPSAYDDQEKTNRMGARYGTNHRL